jgi:chromate transport protein ChrA
MNVVQFLWVPLYLIGAFIDYASRPSILVESMVEVLPAFVIGLVISIVVYYGFKRKTWRWFHVLNTATGIMILWVLFSFVISI